MILEVKPGCCEEASALSRDFFIPCNKPATRMIRWRDQRPYRMCTGCADHNVRNRGAVDEGPFIA